MGKVFHFLQASFLILIFDFSHFPYAQKTVSLVLEGYLFIFNLYNTRSNLFSFPFQQVSSRRGVFKSLSL